MQPLQSTTFGSTRLIAPARMLPPPTCFFTVLYVLIANDLISSNKNCSLAMSLSPRRSVA